MKRSEFSLYAPKASKEGPEKWAKCRHLDCKYRSRDRISCDYLIKTGHSRGCPPGKCTLYTPRESDGID